ncbi:unnamed protein product [marine sediment metagenome]|uniref:Uncharacterized protein n=1 Tax=marine sediment metagenome TaxID=412755 RepID=X1GYU7_9ZZZZ
MAELSAESLEQFLSLFVQERFSQKEARGIKGILKRTVTEHIDDYLIWLVRTFVRCIVNIENEIYIKDITAIIVAEANLATEAPPFKVKVSYNFFDTFESLDFKLFLESEVHRWLVYLQEKGKLPGNYERFTGKFKRI